MSTEKSEQVLQYMLRPSFEACLDLWFGKSEQTDREIWSRFGADVVRASQGHYDHWALDIRHPRRLVALVIMLDQFPRNVYRGTVRMYAGDARCRNLVKRALRAGVSQRLRPIECIFLCLVLTHSERLSDQRLCMAVWGHTMAELAPDDPLRAFQDIFQRHLVVIQRFGRFPHRNKIEQRVSTPAEEAFLADNNFRFDLPLVRRADGDFAFAGSCGQSPDCGVSPATSASAASSVRARPCCTSVAACSAPSAAHAAAIARSRMASSSGSNRMPRDS